MIGKRARQSDYHCALGGDGLRVEVTARFGHGWRGARTNGRAWQYARGSWSQCYGKDKLAKRAKRSFRGFSNETEQPCALRRSRV